MAKSLSGWPQDDSRVVTLLVLLPIENTIKAKALLPLK
jgi:hypothetical protein